MKTNFFSRQKNFIDSEGGQTLSRRTRGLIRGMVFIVTLMTLATSGSFLGERMLEPVRAHGSGEHASEDSADTTTDTARKTYDIQFETHPDPEGIIPDDEPVELLFEVTEDGRPVRDVELSYRVYSPPEPFWFRTDFPVVEGTQLLSGTVVLPEGHQELSMVLPIRGEYRVKALARGPNGVTRESFSFSVGENPQEVVNFSIFLLVLFLIGGIAGYFLLGRSSNTRIASWGVVFLALAGFVVVAPEGVSAHGEGDWDPEELEQKKGTTTLQPETDLILRTFPQPVEVGEMLTLRYRVKLPKTEEHDHDHHGDRAERFRVDSHFVHSEGGLEMVTQSSWFRVEGGSIDVQLFDGAGHYLVSRFYRPVEEYPGSGEDKHAHGEAPGATDKPVETDESAHAHESREYDPGEHAEEAAGPDGPSLQGTNPWEAESRYLLEPGQYTVDFAESDDSSMKWVLLSGEKSRPAEMARRRWDSCESIKPETELGADGSCYDLTLKPDGTSYRLTVKKSGEYHLYTEHLPREFDLAIARNGEGLKPLRKFVTGKGEYLGQRVDWIRVQAVQPPFDSIFKAMVTLLIVVGVGFWFGSRGSGWIG